MAVVADVFERVVQFAHAFGGFDVGRILRLNNLRGVAGDEAEVFDFFIEIFEGEFDGFAGFQIGQREAGEIRDEDVARQVGFFDAVKVAHRLIVGAHQIAPA